MLKIQAIPIDASIFIDDTEYGTGNVETPVTEGDHNLAVRKNGFHADIRDVIVSKEQITAISVVLEPVDEPTGKGRWPWTSERLVTGSDLQGKSKEELELMRNEIYARYGWVFRRQDLQKYFDAQSWYTRGGPAARRDAINTQVTKKMSAIEKQNAAKILNYEKTIGGE